MHPQLMCNYAHDLCYQALAIRILREYADGLKDCAISLPTAHRARSAISLVILEAKPDSGIDTA
jgi:hypothetical protein